MCIKEKYGTTVTCSTYRRHVAGFTRWLELMNYVPSTINYGPVRLAEFLEWMAAHGVIDIDEITGEKVRGFF